MKSMTPGFFLPFLASVFTLLAAGCGRQSSHGALFDAYSGAQFFYLDHVDRARIMQDLSSEVLDNYALLRIKQARHVVDDPRELFARAVAMESSIPDAPDDDVDAQAGSNLAFMDRVLRVIASFKDTHMSVDGTLRRPLITNGLRLASIDGAVRIVTINRRILRDDAIIAEDGRPYTGLAPGDLVVSIDKKPVADCIAELKPFVGQSSPEATNRRALGGLTSRDYFYPKENYAEWVIVAQADNSTHTLKIPYYYRAFDNRLDALHYLNGRGFGQIWPHAAGEIVGYNPMGVPYGLFNANTLAIDDQVVIRTGLFVERGKAYGVLQLFSLLIEGGDRATTMERFFAPITAFIKTLKDAKLPLIIDLRDNSGGDPVYGGRILALIARENDVYPATTRALRITRIIRQMTDSVRRRAPSPLERYNFDTGAVLMVQEAIKQKRPYSGVFSLESEITADPSIGGYAEPVAALIGPECISACDGLAVLMKSSRRVTLVGTPANGTGGGFFSIAPYKSVPWRDAFGFLSVSIPNSLFGIPGKIGRYVYTADDDYLSFNVENMPTQPDEVFNGGLDDYLHNSRSIFAKAIEVIDQRSPH